MSGGGDDGEEGYYSRYEDIAEANDEIGELKEEHKDSLLGLDDSNNTIEERIDRAIENDQNHTDLLTSTISAFGPNSTIYNETGWRVLCAEPLWEVDPGLRNPDAIIGHPDRDTIISVEVKTGLSSPQSALEQIRDAADELLDRSDYIEEMTTISFDSVERVLCVPGRITDRARDAIDQDLREQRDAGEDQPPVFLWKYHRFQEESLKLHTNFNNRGSGDSLHSNDISEYLGSGIEVASCPLLSGSFYPESEVYNIIMKVMFDVLQDRMENDLSTRRFTRSEIFQEIASPRNVPHYDTSTVAEELTDNILSGFLEYNLVSEIDPGEEDHASGTELFEIRSKVDGTRPDTVRRNIRRLYKEGWIESKAEREARKRAIEDFEDMQSDIGDFGG